MSEEEKYLIILDYLDYQIIELEEEAVKILKESVSDIRIFIVSENIGGVEKIIVIYDYKKVCLEANLLEEARELEKNCAGWGKKIFKIKKEIKYQKEIFVSDIREIGGVLDF